MSESGEPSIRAYLDTCLVSALVKNDLARTEQTALAAICRAFESGEVALVCSSVVEDEISKISASHKSEHMKTLKVFAAVPKGTVGGLTQLGAAGVPMANQRHRLWRQLLRILPDENDAWHVYVTACNRIRYLVTVDQRTILSHRNAVLQVSGVHALSPSEFLKLIQADQPNPRL